MIVHESRDVSVRGNTSEPQGDPTVPYAPPSTSCDRIRWCDHPPDDDIISSTDTHASIPSVAPNYDLWASPDHFFADPLHRVLMQFGHGPAVPLPPDLFDCIRGMAQRWRPDSYAVPLTNPIIEGLQFKLHGELMSLHSLIVVLFTLYRYHGVPLRPYDG